MACTPIIILFTPSNPQNAWTFPRAQYRSHPRIGRSQSRPAFSRQTAAYLANYTILPDPLKKLRKVKLFHAMTTTNDYDIRVSYRKRGFYIFNIYLSLILNTSNKSDFNILADVFMPFIWKTVYNQFSDLPNVEP